MSFVVHALSWKPTSSSTLMPIPSLSCIHCCQYRGTLHWGSNAVPSTLEYTMKFHYSIIARHGQDKDEGSCPDHRLPKKEYSSVQPPKPHLSSYASYSSPLCDNSMVLSRTGGYTKSTSSSDVHVHTYWLELRPINA